MPTTYEPIATQTLITTPTSVTFSSIPSTYTDLRLVIVASATPAGGAPLQILFNSDTATNYSYTTVFGTGSTASSGRGTTKAFAYLGEIAQMSATIPSLFEVDIFSYAGSTNKTFLSRASNDLNGSGATESIVGLWRSTSAINSITLRAYNNFYNFTAGSIFTIYGIKNA